MTSQRLRIAPPYSQVFLTDEGDEFFPPEFPEGAVVHARPRGIRIATRMWQDGETTFDLGTDGELSLPDDAMLAFEGEVSVPTETLVLSDPEGVVYWRRQTDSDRVRVRVWTNHPSEPDYVAIEVSPHVSFADAD